jgi:hypothetical protein
VAAAWAVLVILLLDFPAWCLGVHSFSTPRGNWGFFHSNWGMAFTLWLPVILGGTAWISRSLPGAFNCLTMDYVRVIPKDSEAQDGLEFQEALTRQIASSYRIVFWGAALVAAGASALDTYDLWWSYFKLFTAGLSDFPSYRLQHWNTAFRESTPPVSATWNLIFNVDAYLFQGVAIFLGCFFGLKYLAVFVSLARLTLHRDAPYRLNPVWHDVDRRLGLRPLGPAFNAFMVLTIVFQLGVVWHRIELILHQSKETNTFGSYVQRLLGLRDGFDQLLRASTYDFTSIDPGAWAALISAIIPVGIICYFPLLALRPFLRRETDRAWSDWTRTYEEDLESEQVARGEWVRRRLSARMRATCWPNGRLAAARFLYLMGAFILAAPRIRLPHRAGAFARIVENPLGFRGREEGLMRSPGVLRSGPPTALKA